MQDRGGFGRRRWLRNRNHAFVRSLPFSLAGPTRVWNYREEAGQGAANADRRCELDRPLLRWRRNGHFGPQSVLPVIGRLAGGATPDLPRTVQGSMFGIANRAG